jgi:hypothetical protein
VSVAIVAEVILAIDAVRLEITLVMIFANVAESPCVVVVALTAVDATESEPKNPLVDEAYTAERFVVDAFVNV